jgi:hypothetical protein
MNYKRKDSYADIAFGNDPLSIPDKKRAQKVKAKENYKRKPKEEKPDTRYNMVISHGKV